MIEIQIPDSDKHMYLYTMSEVSKILNLKDQDGRHIGRNRMFRCLQYNKVICRDNTPQQYFINMGLAVLHKTTKRWKTYTVLTFTERGIDYLKNGFASGKYVAYVEPKNVINKLKIEDVC